MLEKVNVYSHLSEEHRKIVDEEDNPDVRKKMLDSMRETVYQGSEGADLARRVSKLVNNLLPEDDIEFFVTAMSREHRTLQQNFTRLCLRWFEVLAEMKENNYYDLRNEASCELAEAIIQGVAPEKRFLPTV